MSSFWLALSFLTTFPARQVDYQPGGLSRAALWFPVVGLVLGGVLWLAWLVLRWAFPPLLAAALLVGLWAALTGGLHLDGLVDSGDGLLMSAPPIRRLSVMKDPTVGAFGAVTLIVFLVLKIVAVANLQTVAGLILAPVLARYLLLWAGTRPSARPGGLGDAFGSAMPGWIRWVAGILPVVLIALAGPFTWLGAAIALAVVGLAWWLAQVRLGGLTGDVFGLTVELAELGMLLGAAAALPVGGVWWAT